MRRENHGGNGMKHLAQTEMQAKRNAEKEQLLINKTFVSTQIEYLIELTPPIYKGQKRPTKLELLKHIENPASYIVEKRRGLYLDTLLLGLKIKIWHKNGIPVLAGGTTKDAQVVNDVFAAVKSLLVEILPENQSV